MSLRSNPPLELTEFFNVSHNKIFESFNSCGLNKTIMNFDHAAFQVSDIDKANKWYIEKLGFTFLFQGVNEEQQEAYSFLAYGNSKLELIQDLLIPYKKPEIKKPFCPHVCLEIADMEAGIKFLKENNIPVLRGPLRIENEETWIYFADPDNNILEFIQWFNKK